MANCPPGTHPAAHNSEQCLNNITGLPEPLTPPYYPDPQGSGGNVPPKVPPGGEEHLSDHDWYVKYIQAHPDQYDTGISEGQWIAWRSFWDDASKSFRNENVDNQGNPIGGSGFNKPVDCPAGTTKFNINQCLPLSDWRVGGNGSTAPAAPKATGTGTPAPAPAIPNYSLLPYTSNDLQNSLADMFNYRAGIFGTKDYHLSGATSRAPANEQTAGVWLPGGGAWWGGAQELTDALAPFGKVFSTSQTSNAPAIPGAKPPAPAATPSCPGQQHWDAATNQCVADVSTNPTGPPVPYTPNQSVGPLAEALFGATRGRGLLSGV